MVFNGHEDISSSVHSFSKQFLSARRAGIYALSLERETEQRTNQAKITAFPQLSGGERYVAQIKDGGAHCLGDGWRAHSRTVIQISRPQKAAALCYGEPRNRCLASVTQLSRAREQLGKGGAGHRTGLRPGSHCLKFAMDEGGPPLLLQK